jgi:glycosyltransferase involved in cell wall biosynthesis
MFVKNEEKNLRDCIESVRPIVAEIIIVDTGSTDGTVALAKSITDRVYEIPFTDFGSIRTMAAHFADYPWVLMLDGDERLDPTEWDKIREQVSVSWIRTGTLSLTPMRGLGSVGLTFGCVSRWTWRRIPTGR